jgi:hypothetical protein
MKLDKLEALKAQRAEVKAKKEMAWATYRELSEMENRLFRESVELFRQNYLTQHNAGARAAKPKLRIVN